MYFFMRKYTFVNFSAALSFIKLIFERTLQFNIEVKLPLNSAMQF